MKENWQPSDNTPPKVAGKYRVRVVTYYAADHLGVRSYLPNVTEAEWRLYPHDPLGGRWFFKGKLSPYYYGLIEYLVEIT